MENDKNKTVNYTKEQEALITRLYVEEKMSVEDIAVQLDKPVKSVRGKLVSMKIYVKASAPVAKAKKNDGPSKKELTKVLESLGFSAVGAKGLENATKGAIAEVIERVRANMPAVENAAEAEYAVEAEVTEQVADAA
jgi:hypothetical protein